MQFFIPLHQGVVGHIRLIKIKTVANEYSILYDWSLVDIFIIFFSIFMATPFRVVACCSGYFDF